MIHFYHAKEGLLARFESADLAMAALGKVLWIDMVFPTAEEEDLLERALKIDIPTREDMQEIEMSSRVYNEAGALFLTASVLSLPNGRDPIIAPVTFVLAEGRLVTVRYHAPRSFETFVEQSMKVPMGCGTGAAVLIALFETIVARLADILEAESRALDELSKSVFATTGQRARGAASLAEVLTKIGRTEDLNAKARDSLATIDRLTGYLAQIAPQSKGEEKVPEIAVITTAYYHNSHADMFASRMLKSYTLDGKGERLPARGAFVATTIAFFVAEIGDKTQIATVLLAARYHPLWEVIVGTTLGMLLANVPVVLLGSRFADRLPLQAARYVAAAIFLGLAIWVAVRGVGG